MKFKIGERVEVVKAETTGWHYGKKGVIVEILKGIEAGKEYPYVVEFPFRQRWCFSARELQKKIEEAKC